MMIDPEKILLAIYRAVDEVNAGSDTSRQIGKKPETPLYGAGSMLDSLQLVNLIVATEREVEDEFGIALTLADERALSSKSSPFKSLQSLANYVQTLLKGATNG